MALAGLLLGVSMHRLVAPRYPAVTSLYLSEPAGIDPSVATTTNLSLLRTRLVAQTAITTAHLPVAVNTLLSSYSGSAGNSSSIMSIKVNAPTAQQAVVRANAVAKAFLAVRNDTYAATASSQVAALQTQLAAVQRSISQLTTSITATPDGIARTKLLDQLGNALYQQSNLQTQIGQARSQPLTISSGSYVLDPATPTPVSHKKVLIEDGLSGLIAGLALGLGVVIIGTIVSDRPRTRLEIGSALGSPVTLSLRGPRRSRRSRRRQIARPDPMLRMLHRRLRNQLESTPDKSLAVVAVDDPSLASVAVAGLAFSLLSEGKSVLLADAANERPLAKLLRARKDDRGFQSVSIGEYSGILTVSPDDPAEMAETPSPIGTDAVLLLTSLDPAFGGEHIASWATSAAVFVTAGESSRTRVSAVGQILRDSGILVGSVILFGADVDDESVSILDQDEEPDGHRTNGLVYLESR
jgi:capsular polysaccharide biosynthesis protein